MRKLFVKNKLFEIISLSVYFYHFELDLSSIRSNKNRIIIKLGILV